MTSKDYPKPEDQAGQQQVVALLDPEIKQYLGELTQALKNQNQLLQSQIQRQAQNPFEGTAAQNAVNVFNDIVAGLELRPLPNIPNLKDAAAVSPNKIKLEWDWTDDKIFQANSFKIWRCEGRDCQNFAEIKHLTSEERDHTDVGLSMDTTYRYRVSAVTSFGERFSRIVEAKTKS